MPKSCPAQVSDRERGPPGVAMRLRRQVAVLRAAHGPEIEARDLRRILGFRTITALHHAIAAGTLGLQTRRLAGRRGVFACVEHVAEWLVSSGRCRAIVSTESDD